MGGLPPGLEAWPRGRLEGPRSLPSLRGWNPGLVTHKLMTPPVLVCRPHPAGRCSREAPLAAPEGRGNRGVSPHPGCHQRPCRKLTQGWGTGLQLWGDGFRPCGPSQALAAQGAAGSCAGGLEGQVWGWLRPPAPSPHPAAVGGRLEGPLRNAGSRTEALAPRPHQDPCPPHSWPQPPGGRGGRHEHAGFLESQI